MRYQAQRWYTNTTKGGAPCWHACGPVTTFAAAKADVVRAVEAERAGHAEAAYRITILDKGEAGL